MPTYGGGGFAEGLAQATQGFPQMLMQKKAMAMQQENQDRLMQIESRKELGEAVKGLNDIVNNVDEKQLPTALNLFMNQVEGITKQKIPPELRKGIISNPQDFTNMLTDSFVNNKGLNAENVGSQLNPQAALGMMVAFGAKKRGEEQAQALSAGGQQALTGQAPQAKMATAPEAADTGDQSGVPAPDVPTQSGDLSQSGSVPAPQGPMPQGAAQAATAAQSAAAPAAAAPTGPQDTGGLIAKRDRIEQFLASNPGMPKQNMDLFQKILQDTNAQIATSVEDKSKTLGIAREMRLNPAVPEHQAIISQELLKRSTAEAAANEAGKQDVQPINADIARETGVSPFMRQGEARALPGAAQAQLPSAASLEGAKERARQGEQPINTDLARETGASPFLTQGQARTMEGAGGVQLQSQAQLAGAKTRAEQDQMPIDLTRARELQVPAMMTQGEGRNMQGANTATLQSQAQLEGQSAAARRDAGLVDPNLAAQNNVSPVTSVGEIRSSNAGPGLSLRKPEEQMSINDRVQEQAKTFANYAQEGRDAQKRSTARQQLSALDPNITTGFGAPQVAQLGRIASGLGVNVNGLAPQQAYDALSQRVALMDRKELVGSQNFSDADREMMLNTSESLRKTKEGNRIMRGFAQVTDDRIAERNKLIPVYNQQCGVGGAKCGGKSFDDMWAAVVSDPKNSIQPRLNAVLQQNGVAVPQAQPAQPAANAAPAPAPTSSAPPPSKGVGTFGPKATPTGPPPPLTEQQQKQIEGNDVTSRIKKQFQNSLKF